nr:ATP-binding protein [Streptomyces clavuligerus]
MARALVREARLRGAGTALVVEPLPKEPGPLVRTLTEQQDVTVVLAGPVAYDPGWAPRSVVIPVEDVSAGADPLSVWRAELPDYAGDLATAVGAYRAGGERVRRAARAAVTLADFEGVPVGPGHVRRSARLLSAPLLGRFARASGPPSASPISCCPGSPWGCWASWWGGPATATGCSASGGCGTGGGRGRGVVALFAGDSGTGKTLAAEVVAGELGLDLYVIDLSSVVDKYVGETEKNLERIFAEIDRTDVVLLFDEADRGVRQTVRGAEFARPGTPIWRARSCSSGWSPSTGSRSSPPICGRTSTRRSPGGSTWWSTSPSRTPRRGCGCGGPRWRGRPGSRGSTTASRRSPRSSSWRAGPSGRARPPPRIWRLPGAGR